MMPDAEDRLRSAWLRASERAVPGPACPPPDRIWSAVAGELSPAQLAPLVDHTARCAACAEDWRLARALTSPTRATADTVRARPAGWLPLAATLAAVALGGSVLLRPPAPPADPALFRGVGAPVVESLLRDGQALRASSFALRWSPGPPGTRYDVELSTAGLDTVARARGLEQAWFRVPESALAPLPSGSRLYWRVEALLPGGSRVRSETYSVRLVR